MTGLTGRTAIGGVRIRVAAHAVGKAVRASLGGLAACLGLSIAHGAPPQIPFPVELAGQAVLPAATFIAPPGDAPAHLSVSGRFALPQAPRHGPGQTGLSLPFAGQPVQGFSGIQPAGDGSYWVVSDNGFGRRSNSADALLMIHRVRPDFTRGSVMIERTIFLSDPLRRLPFAIALEDTATRYLTGSDLDPESIQPVADGFWIGDEFGPYLVKLDPAGRVETLVTAMLDGAPLRSPDADAPAPPALATHASIARSAGFEGLAATDDGTRLYAMLEKPVLHSTGIPDDRVVHLLEFDLARRAWTGRSLRYRLEAGASSIGDIDLIDGQRALVLERDDGQGDLARACAAGLSPPGCFPRPARLKRVYLVDLNTSDDGFVRKIGYVDLLAIRDPERRARQRGDDGEAGAPLTFPFVTIESVARIDDDHILVANDNNLPFSSGRLPDRADDSEFILLRVPGLLSARTVPPAPTK